MRWLSVCLLAAGMLAGCAGTTPTAVPLESSPAVPTSASERTAEPAAQATAVPLPTLPPSAEPEPSPTLPPALACSPLAGFELADLPGMVSNPYAPPPPGQDTPHEGVDLAVLVPGTRAAGSGSPVSAAFAGTVALAQADRFPYGSVLIIETALADLPPGALEAFSLADLPAAGLATLEPRSALTCPVQPVPLDWNMRERSLYLVYAHLRDAPALQTGDQVTCGQNIGLVGQSGNALNPHLHLEARIGPSGARFQSMAHYDSSATSDEMASYCLWRVSGLFELHDPLIVLGVR